MVRGGQGLQEQVPDDSVRVTTADVASNPTHRTAAIRLRSVEGTFGPVGGRRFQFWFQSNPETLYLLEARVWNGAVERTTLYVTKPPEGSGAFTLDVLGGGKTVVDTARDEVRMSVSLAIAPSLRKRPPARLTDLQAVIERMAGTSHDDVPPAVPYVLGTPSCVPVGR